MSDNVIAIAVSVNHNGFLVLLGHGNYESRQLAEVAHPDKRGAGIRRRVQQRQPVTLFSPQVSMMIAFVTLLPPALAETLLFLIRVGSKAEVVRRRKQVLAGSVANGD